MAEPAKSFGGSVMKRLVVLLLSMVISFVCSAAVSHEKADKAYRQFLLWAHVDYGSVSVVSKKIVSGLNSLFSFPKEITRRIALPSKPSAMMIIDLLLWMHDEIRQLGYEIFVEDLDSFSDGLDDLIDLVLEWCGIAGWLQPQSRL